MRRVVEHRALMAIAIDDLGLSNISSVTVSALDRGWTLYARKPARGTPLSAHAAPVANVWQALHTLHRSQIAHGDLCRDEITVHDGQVQFGGFDNAEYGATDAQLQSDIAQLLVTTSAMYDPASAVSAAIDAFGRETVLTASRRLTKTAVPARIRDSVT